MPKILLVEDDPMISEVYVTKFRTSGFDVDVAETGHIALQKVRDNKYDLVLLDIVLPEMSGNDVLEEIRTKPDYDPDLKVVMFSNLSEKSDRDRALQLGANGFVPKTEFAPSQLVAEVSRFLRQFSEQKRNGSRDPEEKTQFHGKKILFVEDELIFHEMFGDQLQKEGYVVTYLDGGMIEVSDALRSPYDCIITDMALRGMSGLDVIRLARGSAENAHTPIILFSASVENEADFMRAREQGVTKCFLKTRLTPTDLVQEVNTLVNAVTV